MQNELIDPRAAWRETPPLTVGGVMAVWLQNLGGGLGAAVLAAVLAWQLGADGWSVARWAAIAGAVVFGGLMLLRSAIDEIVDVADYRTMLADMEGLRQELDDAQAAHDEECDRLTTRIRILQNDLNGERQRTWDRHAGPRSHSVIEIADAPTEANQARDDAAKLLERAFAGQNWGKDAMRLYCGMTSTQWAAASDLLKTRGIVARGTKQSYLNYATLADALSALHGVKNLDG